MIGVIDDAMFVRVLAGEKTAPARRAQWDGNKKVLKHGALLADAIDVRRFSKRVARAAQGIPTQVIHQDKNDVRPGCGVGCTDSHRRSREEGVANYCFSDAHSSADLWQFLILLRVDRS